MVFYRTSNFLPKKKRIKNKGLQIIWANSRMTMPVGRHRKQQRLAINYTQHQDGAGYTRTSLKSLNRPSVLVRCICGTLTQALENKSIVKFDFEISKVHTYILARI